VLAHF